MIPISSGSILPQELAERNKILTFYSNNFKTYYYVKILFVIFIISQYLGFFTLYVYLIFFENHEPYHVKLKLISRKYGLE